MRICSLPVLILACWGAPGRAQPAPPRTAPGLIVTGALEQGRLPLLRLGLGDGGLQGQPRPWPDLVRGQARTAGGVLVRVQREGMKLDFPSGAELLVAPDGGVHLRDGSHAPPLAGSVELLLADGSRLRMRTTSGKGRAFERVELVGSGGALLLWQGRWPRHQPISTPRVVGPSLVVLGDGSTVYRAAAAGPLVALERWLCPAGEQRAWPERRVVVVGDLLRQGLRGLPELVPPASVQYPQAPEAAARLAQWAPRLFPTGAHVRPDGALGDLVFELADGFHLACELRDEALFLGLYRGTVVVPAVEWRCGPGARGGAASLHLLRPDGGAGGGPRYFQRGIDQSAAARALLPLGHGPLAARTARQILQRLGARRVEGGDAPGLASNPGGS